LWTALGALYRGYDGFQNSTQKILWLLTLSLAFRVLYTLCDGMMMRREGGSHMPASRAGQRTAENFSG
jgi:hypothetical protein